VGYSASAAQSIYKLTGQGGSDAEKMAGAVAGWASSIAYGISAVKDLFMLIYDMFKSNKSKKDKFLFEAAPKLLSSAQNGLKAAAFFVELANNPASSALATATPVIGIAFNLATAILGFRRWVGANSSMRSALRAQKSDPGKELAESSTMKEKAFRVEWGDNKLVQTVLGQMRTLNADVPDGFFDEPHVAEGDKSEHQLFWKEKRGVRSLSTAYRKKLYYRINPKLLMALRNKERLDQRDATGKLVKRSKDFYSQDYYLEVDGSGKPLFTVVRFADKQVKISTASESAIREYELASKVEEVGRKKSTLAIETIETSIVNLVGEALTLGGITATAGAITKGAMAAINTGFDFARFINKQIDSSQGKKHATSLKYKGEIAGVDKSKTQKNREYYDHAFFIMDQINSLAAPKAILDAARDPSTLAAYREQYKRVQEYVSMTGVYTNLFYSLNGKPKEQIKLIVESLSER
jgi:ribosome maturation factor RimP